MVQGNAILVVDLGNSSTKGKVMFGKDANGKYRFRKFDIPNVFAPIDKDYEVSSDYSTDNSTILRTNTSLNGISICGDFCTGELQARERAMSAIKPSATRKKWECESTVLSMRMAFYQAAKCIMEMQHVSDFDQLDLNWKVVVLLPPGDVDNGKAPITEIIKNISTVDAVFPEVSLPINVETVTVLPEGYCAYIATVYDVGQVYRPEYKYLTEEVIIIFDIGAGTTDVCLVRKNKLIQNSRHTITQGGNNVYQQVKRKLQLDGIDIDDDSIRAGILCGYVKDGSKKIDIVDKINQARNEIADKIISAFQDFIEMSDIKLRSVGYAITCGGGAMSDSTCQGIIPLSQHIINNFKKLSPNAELVATPTEVVTITSDDGNSSKVEQPIPLRELNLLGASILAEVLK